jgi:hypothetical protein
MLEELFAKHPYVIVNTDADGFMCGCTVSRYYGAKIVGFSNSKDKIWVSPEITDITKPVYLDIYINHPDVISIDQHIVAVDTRSNDILRKNPNKINPNIRAGKTLTTDYIHKYPLSTYIFILAMMLHEGVNVELPNMMEYIVGYEHIKAGNILLRADDALYSSLSKYKWNADDWWKMVVEFSGNHPIMLMLMNHIDLMSRCNKSPEKLKDEINRFFLDVLHCDGGDGGFTDILQPDEKTLRPEFVRTVKFFSSLFKCGDVEIPQEYNIYKGDFTRASITYNNMDFARNMIESDNMFSYAFIYGPNGGRDKGGNFSYTTNLRRQSRFIG